MNLFYDWFDGPKWIDFTGADYLTDNDDISAIFFWLITLPKVTVDTGTDQEQSISVMELMVWKGPLAYLITVNTVWNTAETGDKYFWHKL